jgi:hypothetical protein
MRGWLAAAVIAVGLLAWHGQAQASCRSFTYTDMRSGTIVFCPQCCYGNICNVTCF